MRSENEPARATFQSFCGLMLLVIAVAILCAAWAPMISKAAFPVQIVCVLAAILIPGAFIGQAVRNWVIIWHDTRIIIEQRRLELERARNEENRRKDLHDAEVEAIKAKTRKLDREAPADERGNYPVLIGVDQHRVTVLPGGNFAQNVPHTYHYSATNKGGQGTTVQEEKPATGALPLPLPHIPTFAESLRSGDVGQGQQEVLICYELLRDEEGKLTGEIEPYQDQLENNSTMFLGGGSKSGKSTLITHLSAQQALMGACYYLIDPHLMHPEKSIAKRLEPLQHAFILPPAMTDADIYTVLMHAKTEAEARLSGKETPLSGRPLVFIVDEALNLFGRAQRTDNRDIQQLYRELALFMRDLGTQYNKFLVNGIFASQYVTKDAFKLPGGSVDFRDGCQSQGLLRLPPNQAQAMRLLPSEELRGMRSLPAGHGYMGFYSGDIIRMAFGNVTVQDIELVGRIVERSPLTRTQFSTPSVPNGTREGREVQDSTDGTAYPSNVRPLHSKTVDAISTVQQDVTQPGEPSEPSIERVQKVKPKEFTSEQELEFVRLYRQKPDIKACLAAMRLGIGTYYACASQVVERRKLRKA